MESESITFKSELLREHELFTQLKTNPPTWWNTVKNHSELYIEIRKNNYINIYYKGGSIAKIEYNEKSEKITVKTHPKYLGRDNYEDANYYYKTKKNGKIVYVPIYQPCEDWLENRLDEMLSNVDRFYNSKEKQEQSRMIRMNHMLYIDSEFEHLYKRNKISNKKYKNDYIRIDLVELRNNTIRFVELKMISDGRLLKKDENKPPEIYDQMWKYKCFAEKYKDELRVYYQKLYRIKKDLGLPVPAINIKALEIEPIPVLVIVNDYDKKTQKRIDRIKSINKKMMQKSDVFQFEKLSEENYTNTVHKYSNRYR